MFCSFVQIRLSLGAALGPFLVWGLLFTTGCWNEVAYDTPSSNETTDPALRTVPATVPAEEPANEPSAEAPVLLDPEEIVSPDGADRYAATGSPAEAPDEEVAEALLPWETASSTQDSSPKAERLFRGSSETQIATDESKETGTEVTEEVDDFESFLAKAYADVEVATSNAPEVEELAKEPSREIRGGEKIAGIPLPDRITPFATESTDQELPNAEPPMEEESLDSLFGDSDESESAAPAFAPAPFRYGGKSSPRPPRELPMAEPAEARGPKIESLPEVPVLPSNTRHLAWLLGGKLSLAQLAGVGGATTDEIAGWTEETRRLAEQLKVAAPPSADPGASATERIGRLLDFAAEIGNSLTAVYGPDHAALFEMSLKTNALLVLHEDRPDLTPIVARAVSDAADRTELPGYVWRDTIKVLERQPTVDEVYDAVIKLHSKVEAYLR